MSALAWYFLKLVILLPVVGGMAFGCLWLYRKYQPGMLAGQQNRSLKLLEALPMGTFGKLAVVEFEGKKLLLSVTRGQIQKLAESDPNHG
jgi:flagellar protein FliO/FliZ